MKPFAAESATVRAAACSPCQDGNEPLMVVAFSIFLQLQFAKRACAVDFSTAQLQRCVRSSILYACERTVRCRLAHDAADPRLLNRRIRSLTGQKLGGLFSCGQDMWLRPARSVCVSSHPFAGPLLPRKLQRCGRGDAVAFAPAANDCSRGHLCFRPEIFEPQTSSFVVTWHPFLPPYISVASSQESGQPDQEAWWTSFIMSPPVSLSDLYFCPCVPRAT